MRDLLDDPMPTEPPSRPGHRWVRTELGWGTEPIPKAKGQTPHAKLKHAARAAIPAWRVRTGASVLLIPSVVGQVTVPDGTGRGKLISIGRKGQSDDLILVGRAGVAWGVLLAEYKSDGDVQRDAQRKFQDKAEAAGGVYAIIRKPSDMTDALDRIAARRGAGG